MAARRRQREDRTKSRILAVLESHADGLTISDIARLLGVHYATASKYLAVLEAEDRITRRDIGMAKVYRLGGKR